MAEIAAERDESAGSSHPIRVLIVATEALRGPDLLDELRRDVPLDRTKFMVVSPATERSQFDHGLGDVEGARREARQRLKASLEALSGLGISALGETGDGDPVVVAAEALRQYPADEVLIVAHADDQARWFESGLFQRAQETLYPAVRLIEMRYGDEGEGHLVGVERAGAGRRRPGGADDPARAESLLRVGRRLARWRESLRR